MSTLDSIVQYLSGILNWPALTTISVIVVELVLRLAKTSKPLSIALFIRDILLQLAKICQLLADILDKVVPQRLKEEEVKELPKEEKK